MTENIYCVLRQDFSPVLHCVYIGNSDTEVATFKIRLITQIYFKGIQNLWHSRLSQRCWQRYNYLETLLRWDWSVVISFRRILALHLQDQAKLYIQDPFKVFTEIPAACKNLTDHKNKCSIWQSHIHSYLRQSFTRLINWQLKVINVYASDSVICCFNFLNVVLKGNY